MRSIGSLFFGCIFLALTNGCATKALWESGRFDVYKEPAKPSGLALFENPKTGKALVVYNEHAEMTERVQKRAYWVDPSSDAPANPYKPHFVQVTAQKNLPPVSLRPVPAPAGLSVVSTNDHIFVFHRNGQPLGKHQLPAYSGSEERFTQIAFTPLTFLADLTIIGGFLLVSHGLPGWSGTL
jgi:hypothetical protein